LQRTGLSGSILSGRSGGVRELPGAAGPASKAKAIVAVRKFLETGNLVMVILPN
jgi:hypothetical protein